MRAVMRLVTSLPVLLAGVLASCGGTNDGGGFGGGSTSGTGGPAKPGGSSSGTFGSGGSGTSQPCSSIGSTQSCCTTGTQTCTGGSEFPVWGPCVDSNGATLTCSGGGGNGSEDGGGGHGGNGGEDGGAGTPGGGGEDAALPIPALCNDQNVNNEPEILVGYSPAPGQTVGAHGQIRVWVNDENPPIIAPNEQVDPATGAIKTPGDRTAKAPDGYLWEPALYIAPQTAENGGTPHFPQYIKGWYDPDPTGNGGVQVAGMDPVPAGSQLSEQFTGEDIWDVSALGLAPGTYMAEFVIHDGDDDRAVGCVTIVVTPN